MGVVRMVTCSGCGGCVTNIVGVAAVVRMVTCSGCGLHTWDSHVHVTAAP